MVHEEIWYEKGKIKISKVIDNTAAEAEILIHLPAGADPEMTRDSLYAFTDCEVSKAVESSGAGDNGEIDEETLQSIKGALAHRDLHVHHIVIET